MIFYVLPDFGALEPFGTDRRYTRFLQGSIAPVLRGFAGADVRLDAGMTGLDRYGACLALAAPEETYDWEVRQALEAWTKGASARSQAIGLAVGERQRYRGVALVFGDEPLTPVRPEDGRFGATLVSGAARAL